MGASDCNPFQHQTEAHLRLGDYNHMAANISSPALADKPAGGLLSVKEASAFLNISEGMLARLGIPTVRVRRRRLYRPTDLNDFVERNLSHGRARGAK